MIGQAQDLVARQYVFMTCQVRCAVPDEMGRIDSKSLFFVQVSQITGSAPARGLEAPGARLGYAASSGLSHGYTLLKCILLQERHGWTMTSGGLNT